MAVLENVLADVRGKKLVKAKSDTITVPIGGANQGIVLTFAEVAKVQVLIGINITTDPVVDVSVPQNVTYDDNVVGLTLAVAAGTTLTVEGYALAER